MQAHLKPLNPLPHQSAISPQIRQLCRKSDRYAYYKQRLQPRKRVKYEVQEPQAYCETLLRSNKKRQLIELEASEAVEALQLQLQAYCLRNGRAYFYIDSPEMLVCSANFIRREGQLGFITPGPGGALHDFLTQTQAQGLRPLLLVNYDSFRADDIVRLNSLLDDRGRADGTPLPEALQLVGIINRDKPDCYQGSDFYGRFHRRRSTRMDAEQLSQGLPALPVIKPSPDKDSVSIKLYHGSDWKERLLGRWVMQGHHLVYEEGELIKALATGLPLRIENGLWNQPEFTSFWKQALLRGHIDYGEQHIAIPASLGLIQSEGYDWPHLLQDVDYSPAFVNQGLVLNPGNLPQYFNQYSCDNEAHTLHSQPGLIAAHAGQAIDINITRALSNDAWAMLLDEARKYGVRLTLHAYEGSFLPQHITSRLLVIPNAVRDLHDEPRSQAREIPRALGMTSSDEAPQNNLVIKSQDTDSTLTDFNDWLVFDISECTSASLLSVIDGELNDDKLSFRFTQRECALLTALNEGRRVVLKGRFSDELADALAPLLLQRRQNPHAPGQLVLISNDTHHFDYLNPRHHAVNADYKRQALLNKGFAWAEIARLPDTLLTQDALSRLETRLLSLRDNPHQSDAGEMAWQGMHGLPARIQLEAFDPVNSAAKAAAFNAARLEAVNRILAQAPFVYLTGLTAVGKTSFVEQMLSQGDNKLFRGEGDMRRWAEDTGPGRKILFIDEANLSARQWSEFEGLFNKPPGILINGVYHPLSEQHKVVFAGNPLSYGAGRQLAPFFQRHR